MSMDEYLQSLIPKRNGLIAVMEEYARLHNVPIMEPEGMDALLQILRLKNPQTILEVGAAIGYSALRMAEALPDVKIVTIERDEERIGVAKENIRKACAQDRVMSNRRRCT